MPSRFGEAPGRWWRAAPPLIRLRIRGLTGRRGIAITGGLLVVIVLAVLLAPVISPYQPLATSNLALVGPSGAHLIGTDELGRDVLSRTLSGGRTSLAEAVLSVLMATTAGTVLGLVAGYAPRAVSVLIMRVMDVILGFPALLLALLVLAMAGAGMLPEAIAISIAFLPVFTRVVYQSSLSIREEGYVTAARVAGVRAVTIMRRHILPAVRTEVIVLMTSSFGWALLLGATLSFLGLGAQPPTPDWGADLSNGQSYLVDGWWISLAPGVAITLTVLLVNLLGDQLSAGSGRRPDPATVPVAPPTVPPDVAGGTAAPSTMSLLDQGPDPEGAL